MTDSALLLHISIGVGETLCGAEVNLGGATRYKMWKHHVWQSFIRCPECATHPDLPLIVLGSL